MAIEKVDVGISDTEMFRSAMADEPAAEPEAQPAEKPRDELGRFAPKAEDTPVAAIEQQPEQVKEQQPTPDKDEAQVPSWRLRELREQREAAEERARQFEVRSRQSEERLAAFQRQWEQSQPKPEPVDFFANPDAAMDQRLTPFEARMEALNNKLVLRASKAEAMAEHGVAVVKEMEQAIGKAMQEGHPEMRTLSMEMRQSDDPVSVAMNWYRRDKLLKETGGDIAGYRSKLEGDLLKDPAFQAKAMEAWRLQASQPGNSPKVQIPPSLNRASGSAGNAGDDAGDMSDASLWAAAKPQARGRK